jgi:erythronate-4-phosphate dehydrogenase
MKVLLNDPPLQRTGVKRSFVNLEKILSADIITLHTQLNLMGPDKTFHLLNKRNLNKIIDGAVLINTARGAVINNTDLLEVIEYKNLKVVLDVWENEPDIKIELLKQVLIATPHIAGYSLEGKINGTKIIYNSICTYLKTRPTFSFDTEHPSENIKVLKENDKIEISLNTMISSIYSIIIDDKKMRKILNMQQEEAISYFDLQRKEYPTRREFNNFKIKSEKLSETTKILLNKLRFKLIT